MDITIILFLSSGLFLGWSLGANDAANVFGTAVGTRMISFRTAALVSSVFVILGAVISGVGVSQTLGELGSITALGGAFTAALSAATVVFLMTHMGSPVSSTQAVVGAIVGWNLFSGSPTDPSSLSRILMTWVLCPVLAASIAVPLYMLVKLLLRHSTIHIFRLDAYTRLGLLFAGAFGAYALGANNIASVMGVFVPVSPFTSFNVADLFEITSIQQLFLLGGIAIAVGIFTYSKRVMLTVGDSLFSLSPISAWVVVVAHSLTLILFSSVSLEAFLASHALPTIPLVPVSSSQAVVGAIAGIGLYQGGRILNWRALGSIGSSWVATPILAALLCFLSLFVMQNVFDQTVL